MVNSFGIFNCFLIFGTILILFFSGLPFVLLNLRNHNTFSHQASHTYGPLPHVMIFFKWVWITILDPEPNLDFQIFLNMSKTNHQIFNYNISDHTSGQVLPFIFPDLRAPIYLQGCYDPKTLKILHFLHISPPHSLPVENI